MHAKKIVSYAHENCVLCTPKSSFAYQYHEYLVFIWRNIYSHFHETWPINDWFRVSRGQALLIRQTITFWVLKPAPQRNWLCEEGSVNVNHKTHNFSNICAENAHHQCLACNSQKMRMNILVVRQTYNRARIHASSASNYKFRCIKLHIWSEQHVFSDERQMYVQLSSVEY